MSYEKNANPANLELLKEAQEIAREVGLIRCDMNPMSRTRPHFFSKDFMPMLEASVL